MKVVLVGESHFGIICISQIITNSDTTPHVFFCRVRKGIYSCPLPVHYIVPCFSNTVFPSGFSSWRAMKWILVVTLMGFRITLETNLSLSVRCWLDELRWEDLPEMWLAPLYRLGSRIGLEGESDLNTGSDSSPLVNRCTVANYFQLLPHDSPAMLDSPDS